MSFNFISCLGHGSFGVVLKSGCENGTFSAVKVVFLDSNEADNKSISRECTILADKRHPNIVQMEDVCNATFNLEEIEALTQLVEDEEALDFIAIQSIRAKRQNRSIPAICIRMELCGPTLRDWLGRSSPKSKEDSSFLSLQVRIVQGLIKGMEFLHGNKIIHRDFKPENVLFSSGNPANEFQLPVKIGDFGLCRILHSELSKTSSLTSRAGTPDYMAPENINGGNYGFPSDLYSLGLVIWEVCQLIAYKEHRKLFDELVNDRVTSLVESHPLLHDLPGIVVKLTKRNVSERYSTMAELLDNFKLKLDLECFLGCGTFGFVFKNSKLNAVKMLFRDEGAISEILENYSHFSLRDISHPNLISIRSIMRSDKDLEELNQLANLIQDTGANDRISIFTSRAKRSQTTLSCLQIEMELAAKSLRNWIEQKISQEKGTFQLHIVSGLLAGVQHLHGLGIVHRDIKPENVLFSSPGYSLPVKLTDFGLNIPLVNETKSRTTSRFNNTSELYYAPEIKRGQPHSLLSDLFALGLVIWEVVQEIPQKRKPGHFDTLVYDGEVDLVEEHPLIHDIPAIIETTTRKNPSERYKDIDELISIWNAKTKPAEKPVKESVAIQKLSFQEQLPTERYILMLQEESMESHKIAFTRWANNHLKKANITITDLYSDLRDGQILLKLVELLFGLKSVSPSPRPLHRIHMIENVNKSLDLLRERLPMGNYQGAQVVDGERRIILAIMWSIIRFCDILGIKGQEHSGKPNTEHSAVQVLLQWCKNRVTQVGIENIVVKDFKPDTWKSGLALNVIIHSYRPDLIGKEFLTRPDSALKNAVEVAETQLKIPQLFDTDDMRLGKVEEKVIIMYVASLYLTFTGRGSSELAV